MSWYGIDHVENSVYRGKTTQIVALRSDLFFLISSANVGMIHCIPKTSILRSTWSLRECGSVYMRIKYRMHLLPSPLPFYWRCGRGVVDIAKKKDRDSKSTILICGMIHEEESRHSRPTYINMHRSLRLRASQLFSDEIIGWYLNHRNA